MNAKALTAMLASVPAGVREQTALETRVFETLNDAEQAAKAYFTQFRIDEHEVRLVYRLAGTLGVRRGFFTRGGKLMSGAAYTEEIAA